MTSTTSSVNPARQTAGVLKWQLRRSAAFTAVYTVMLLLLFPAVLSVDLSKQWYNLADRTRVVFADTAACLMPAVALALLFTLVFTLSNFRYLHNKREIDLFHSLPVSRSSLFWGKLLAGYLCVILPFIPVFLLQGLSALCFGGFSLHFALYLLMSFGLLALLLAASLAFMVFVAMCSGSTLDTVVSIGLLAIAVPVLFLEGWYLIINTIPGVGSAPNLVLVTYLAPPASAFVPYFNNFRVANSGYNAMDFSQVMYPQVEPLHLLAWAVLGAVFLLAALYLYRRRKSESAESTLAYTPAKMAARLLACSAVGVGAGLLYFGSSRNNLLMFSVCALIASLAVYFITELVYARGLQNLKRHALPYLLFPASLAVFLVTVSFGLGLDTQLPKMAEISTVSSNGTFSQSEFMNYARLFQEGSEDPLYLSLNLRSEDNVKKTLEANQKLIESARADCYPYSFGYSQTSLYYDRYQNLVNFYYGSKESPQVSNRQYALREDATPEAKKLFEEGIELLKETKTSDEYVYSALPVFAIDAVQTVRQYDGDDGAAMDTTMTEINPSSPDQPDYEALGWKQISTLPNQQEFRKKLEAALIDDIKAGRFLLSMNQISEIYKDRGDSSETTLQDSPPAYGLTYTGDLPFTARGGYVKDEPVAGKVFTLAESYTVPISSAMTETYALLSSLYQA